MKTVRDVMRHRGRGVIYSVLPIASVYEAIEKMAEEHVGALPVLQDGKLVGVVSERDYARKVILKDKSSKQTRVSEIMTREVVTVTSGERVEACMELMQRHHIRHLVVVDAGVVIGMLSLRDLLTEVMAEQASLIDQLEHYIRGDQ